MARRLCWLVLLLSGGCFHFSSETPNNLVSNNPFGTQATPQAAGLTTKANYPAGNQEISKRVNEIGQKIIAANPQTGLKPIFGTIGVAQPEVFHLDTRMIYVTEGLVKQCKSEAELAAILSHQLGRMVADREARAGADVRNPDRLPPIQVQVGNAGRANGEDGVALVERAKFEKAHPKTRGPLPIPDAKLLARTYLEKTGYQRADLDAVQPLLAQAEQNVALERQLKGQMPQSNWLP